MEQQILCILEIDLLRIKINSELSISRIKFFNQFLTDLIVFNAADSDAIAVVNKIVVCQLVTGW